MTELQSAYTRIESQTGRAEADQSAPLRVLVVADAWCQIDGVCAEVRRVLEGAVETEVFVIAPALVRSSWHTWVSDIDEETETARQRLETILARLARYGVSARGQVAADDPVLALQDALAEFIPERVIFVSDDARHQTGRERTLFSRMTELCPVAIHIAVRHELAF